MIALYALKDNVVIRHRKYSFGDRIIRQRGLVPNRKYRVLRNNGSIGTLEQLKALRKKLEQVDDLNGSDDNVAVKVINPEPLKDAEIVEGNSDENDELVQESEPESEIITTEEIEESRHIYTREALEVMKMPELRPIGKQFDVKDNKASDLVDKILDAQEKLSK